MQKTLSLVDKSCKKTLSLVGLKGGKGNNNVGVTS